MSSASARIYDLWMANGQPERIGYAAIGGYVDAGTRQVAAGLNSCAGGAMGLRWENLSGGPAGAGRLVGRWCGGVASGTPATAGYTIPARIDGQFGFTFVTTQAPWILSPEYITNPYGYGAVLSLWWSDYYGVPGSHRVYFPPGARLSLYAEVLGPHFGGVSDGSRAKHIQGTAGWEIPAVTVPPHPAVPATLDAAVDAVAEINLATIGAPWITASAWSRSGEWVRRKAWTDSQMMLRHESGPGTSRAVAVLKSSTVTTPRAVRSTEFGPAEFSALDWVMKYPPAGNLDLTDAMIAVDAEQWVLWNRALVPTPTPTPTPTPDPTPTPTPLPKTGEGFLYLKNGVQTLVPARDESGANWSP